MRPRNTYSPTTAPSATQIEIRKAKRFHYPAIKNLYAQLRSPHARRLSISEYFVACIERKVVGCAAVRRVGNDGYLYGRTVERQWRNKGIGTALVVERIHWLRKRGASIAVGLVMFWNVASFRRLGFRTIPKRALPKQFLSLKDFESPRNRYAAAMVLYF